MQYQDFSSKVFSVQNVFAEVICGTLSTTLEEKQFKKFVLAFRNFWFSQKGYRKNFAWFIIKSFGVFKRALRKHATGVFENI